jgi:hypothetical protein
VRVTFSIAAKGQCRVAEDVKWCQGNFELALICSRKGKKIDRLEYTIRNVSRERWPYQVPTTLRSQDGLPVFPFETQPNALSFVSIRDNLIKLEGVLAVSYDFVLDWSRVSEKWVSETEADKAEWPDGMGGFTASPVKPAASFVSKDIFVKAILTAGTNDTRLLAFPHFQYAAMHHKNGNNLDTIRHSFFLIEELFAPGKFKSNELRLAFQQSQHLEHVVVNWIRKNPTRFKHLQNSHPSQFVSAHDFGSFINSIIELRGRVQHTQKH